MNAQSGSAARAHAFDSLGPLKPSGSRADTHGRSFPTRSNTLMGGGSAIERATTRHEPRLSPTSAVSVTFCLFQSVSQAQTAPAVPEPSQPLRSVSPAQVTVPTEDAAKVAAAAVISPAHSASAVLISDSRNSTTSAQEPATQPPVLLIYLAALVVIIFVTSRRRRDDS